MKTVDGRDVMLLGFGESEDPTPEQPQYTRYKVFAGECKQCSRPGRKLLSNNTELILVCDTCQTQVSTGIKATEISEVTYIYWCNKAKFSSDLVELPLNDIQQINALIAEFEQSCEVPHWAVSVVGGRCSSSEQCISFECPYLIKSQ